MDNIVFLTIKSQLCRSYCQLFGQGVPPLSTPFPPFTLTNSKEVAEHAQTLQQKTAHAQQEAEPK